MVRAVGRPKIHSNWSASAGQLVFTRDNASVGITWGEDGSGIDNTWYGDTSGVYARWDESADALLFVNAALTQTGAPTNIASASITTLAATSVNIAAAGRFSIGAAGTVSVASAVTISLADGVNFQLSTASGTKIGTASTQKIGFFGATPVVQQANVASGAASSMAESIITALKNLGFLCTS